MVLLCCRVKAGFWRRFRRHQKSNRTLRDRLLSFLNCPKNVVAVAPPNRSSENALPLLSGDLLAGRWRFRCDLALLALGQMTDLQRQPDRSQSKSHEAMAAFVARVAMSGLF